MITEIHKYYGGSLYGDGRRLNRCCDFNDVFKNVQWQER